MSELGLEDAITLVLYGVIVLLTLLGGIFGPPIVLLPGAALAILWVVVLLGHFRDRNKPG